MIFFFFVFVHVWSLFASQVYRKTIYKVSGIDGNASNPASKFQGIFFFFSALELSLIRR